MTTAAARASAAADGPGAVCVLCRVNPAVWTVRLLGSCAVCESMVGSGGSPYGSAAPTMPAAILPSVEVGGDTCGDWAALSERSPHKA